MSLEDKVKHCNHNTVEHIGTQEGFGDIPSIELANCMNCYTTISFSREAYEPNKNYNNKQIYTKKKLNEQKST